MADGVDIDLYADVEQDFPQEDFSGENNDLYDDVITAGSNKDEEKNTSSGSLALTPKKEESESGSGNVSRGGTPADGRKWQLYIGNLTWWTTDQDIQDNVQNLGVSDFLEVKFYENRANGQSKGFCCVSLGSEASSKKVMENFSKKELHGQKPVVTYATKQALHQFESQSKTRPPQQAGQGAGGPRPSGPSGPMGRAGPMRGPPPGALLGAPPPIHYAPRGPPPGLPPPGLPPPMRGPPPAVVGRPPPGLPPHVGPPPVSGPPPGLPPPGHIAPPAGPPPVPGAHVNPAFFPPGSVHVPAAHGLSEPEFEEIMSRNR